MLSGHISADVSHACLQAEFQLGNVEDGFLPSAFLAGLLIASIVYSELTTRYNAFRMTGVHMLLNGLHLPSQAALSTWKALAGACRVWHCGMGT